MPRKYPVAILVIYDANGGEGSPSTQYKKHGSNLTLSSTQPTRAGYKFKGWSTSQTATSATYTNQQTVKNLTATNGGTVTLYAVWELEQTVFYAKNNQGTWVDGLAYVKINGAWVKAKQVYVKKNGAWVLGKME